MSLQLPALEVSQIALQPLQMLVCDHISFLGLMRTSAALSAAAQQLRELMQLVNLSTGQHKAEGHTLPQYVLKTF
jgi:hypothetical protein